MRNPDAELQQRSVEYFQLSRIATVDVLATVAYLNLIPKYGFGLKLVNNQSCVSFIFLKILEEMPPFPEKESSLLAKLKKSKPHVEELENQTAEKKQRPQAIMNQVFKNFFTRFFINSTSIVLIETKLHSGRGIV